MLIDINGEIVTLLSDKVESNLNSYYPSSFFADSKITQEPENLEFPNTSGPLHATDDSDQEQMDLNEFIHLDPNSISKMGNNYFLQICKVAKEKYFGCQEVFSISYSVQPTHLDDIVSAEFEKSLLYLILG